MPTKSQFPKSSVPTPIVVDVDRVIEMAWEDRTPFDAIKAQFGLSEADVIALMRRELKPSSWRLWRARVAGRNTKHLLKRPETIGEGDARFRCKSQRSISLNKMSKR